MSRKHNITGATDRDKFFRGEDKVLTITIDDGATPPVALNITGWTLAFTLRLTPESLTALLTKTTGAGISLTDPLIGVLQVSIADTDTINLTPGKYAYDVKRMDAGAEAVLVYGTLTLLAEVTR
jgi:hypothetical protein